MNAVKTYFRPAGQAKRPAVKAPPAPVNTQLPLPAPVAGRGHDTPLASPSSQGRSPQRTLYGSRSSSRPSSLFQQPFADVDQEALAQLKCDMMVDYIWRQQLKETWSASRPGEGVVLKKARNQYVCAPRTLASEPYGLFHAVQEMNVRVCLFYFFPIEARSLA